MHENRPVVFAGAGYEKKAQLFDYTITNTWEESKYDFTSLSKSTYLVWLNCIKLHCAVKLLLLL